eukprot:scaffold268969_cov32-Tisochrysis_lutea.AAC.3
MGAALNHLCCGGSIGVASGMLPVLHFLARWLQDDSIHTVTKSRDVARRDHLSNGRHITVSRLGAVRMSASRGWHLCRVHSLGS